MGKASAGKVCSKGPHPKDGSESEKEKARRSAARPIGDKQTKLSSPALARTCGRGREHRRGTPRRRAHSRPHSPASHSTVTAQSQHSHSTVTAQSTHVARRGAEQHILSQRVTTTDHPDPATPGWTSALPSLPGEAEAVALSAAPLDSGRRGVLAAPVVLTWTCRGLEPRAGAERCDRAQAQRAGQNKGHRRQ